MKRQKKKISAKEEAEKREKILADLDDEFGVKSIVEEEAMKEKIKRYKSSDLRGLKVIRILRFSFEILDTEVFLNT